MTPRKRVEAILRGDVPDKVPLTMYESKIPQCTAERQLRNEGCCIVYRRVSAYKTHRPNVRQDSHPFVEDGVSYVKNVTHTPVGDLEEVSRPAGFTSWRVSKLFKKPEDYKALMFMVEDERYEENYAAYAKAEETFGEDFILRASVGFGGSCFRKDILNLVYLCEHYGLHEVAAYWEQVVKMNEYQQGRFVSNMVSAMFDTVAGKRIALFGAAFKAHTSDTRESPALAVCRALLDERADMVITDPYALDNARDDLGEAAERVTFEPDPYAAARDAHAIAVLTEWPHFAELDYTAIYESMVKPAFIFDGRNILDHQELYAMGFNVYAIGKPPLTHFATNGLGSAARTC